jgi:hypothetical protein
MQTIRKQSKDRDSPAVARWLSPTSLPRIVRPEASSGNPHGVMTPDHLGVKWPMPIMFGSENYSFSLVDLADDRFSQEAAKMSENLAELFTKQQVIENEWRIAYKKFLEAEKRRNNLTAGVLQKSIDKADADLADARERVLSLQSKRDEFQMKINEIWDRCREVKDGISRESDLEKLRQDLSESIQSKIDREDIFWKSKFKVRSSMITTNNALSI